MSPLDGLPKTFGLNCQAKLFFPHLFNIKDNYTKHLNGLPDQHYYIPGGMKVGFNSLSIRLFK
jgi:hypothetical protein